MRHWPSWAAAGLCDTRHREGAGQTGTSGGKDGKGTESKPSGDGISSQCGGGQDISKLTRGQQTGGTCQMHWTMAPDTPAARARRPPACGRHTRPAGRGEGRGGRRALGSAVPMARRRGRPDAPAPRLRCPPRSTSRAHGRGRAGVRGHDAGGRCKAPTRFGIGLGSSNGRGVEPRNRVLQPP